MNIYGYVGHTTDRMDHNNQYYGILSFATNNSIGNVQFVVESDLDKDVGKYRILADLLLRITSGDMIIVSNLRIFSNNMIGVVDILNVLVHKGVKIYSVEGDELGWNVEPRVVAFVKSVADDIVANAAENRLKESTNRKRPEGSVVHGRPVGSIGVSRLDGHEEEIVKLLSDGVAKAEIARQMDVSRPALHDFIVSRKLLQIVNK